MKCAKKIWQKFNEKQKRIWKEYYTMFLESANYPPSMFEEKEKIEVIAHNHACLVAWGKEI